MCAEDQTHFISLLFFRYYKIPNFVGFIENDGWKENRAARGTRTRRDRSSDSFSVPSETDFIDVVFSQISGEYSIGDCTSSSSSQYTETIAVSRNKNGYYRPHAQQSPSRRVSVSLFAEKPIDEFPANGTMSFRKRSRRSAQYLAAFRSTRSRSNSSEYKYFPVRFIRGRMCPWSVRKNDAIQPSSISSDLSDLIR